MKKIIYVAFALVCGAALYSCSDTTDCVCPVSTELLKKASTSIPVNDWDGDCSDITSKDIEGKVLEGDCTEE